MNIEPQRHLETENRGATAVEGKRSLSRYGGRWKKRKEPLQQVKVKKISDAASEKFENFAETGIFNRLFSRI